MIHHISISAHQPQHVAQVLAQLCQGQSAPFPHHEGSYIVLALDPHGTMIEVMPQGIKLTPNTQEFGGSQWVRSAEDSQQKTYNAFHAAISVPTPEATIYEIAAREGWHCALCDRLGYFSIIEVWIENQQLLEFLPPNLLEQNLAFMQPQHLQQFLDLPNNESVEELLKLNSKP
jgi:hypothetical protein